MAGVGSTWPAATSKATPLPTRGIGPGAIAGVRRHWHYPSDADLAGSGASGAIAGVRRHWHCCDASFVGS